MAKHDMNPVNSSSPESGATVRGGGTRTSEDQAQNGAGGGKGPGNNNIATCISYRLIWNSSVNHKINPIETPCMLPTFTYCLAFIFYHNIQTYVIHMSELHFCPPLPCIPTDGDLLPCAGVPHAKRRHSWHRRISRRRCSLTEPQQQHMIEIRSGYFSVMTLCGQPFL